MSYNLSTSTVERWKGTLDKLSGGVVILKSRDPFTLGYRLREAIAAARHNQIEPYCDLDYVFQVDGLDLVAKPKKTGGMPQSIKVTTRRYEAAISEYDIVKIAKDSSADVLEFPAFSGELHPVEVWSGVNGFSVITEPYLTLIREDGEDGQANI